MGFMIFFFKNDNISGHIYNSFFGFFLLIR